MSRESQVIELFTRETDPLSVADIAAREGCSRPTIYMILKRNGVALTRARKASFKRQEAGRTGQRKLRDSAGAVARFVSYHVDPADVIELRADHPAIVEGRTLFPTTVAKAMDSPRILVSGKNNPKTGGMVLKGAWKGMPIFVVTLEERKTCPRSCVMWGGCMGSAMPFSRRHDAYDPDFIGALAAEVITTCRANPQGIVVRLHVLGDFYSVAYVKVWAHLLAMLPGLHCFGYTARRSDDPDPESARIGQAIEEVRRAWSRFAIRTSHAEPGPMRAIVRDVPSDDPSVLTCPAQLEKTAACSTCLLCFTPAARDKTILFLRHGMTRKRGSHPS